MSNSGKDLFEFVVIEAPTLHHTPANPGPFKQHFLSRSPPVSVLAFSNLTGDTRLVIPALQQQQQQQQPALNVQNSPGIDSHKQDLCEPRHCAHLASFLASAPLSQVQEMFRMVALEAKQVLSNPKVERVWISTHGNGVAWLHIRVDTIPKYYSYKAYRGEVGEKERG